MGESLRSQGLGRVQAGSRGFGSRRVPGGLGPGGFQGVWVQAGSRCLGPGGFQGVWVQCYVWVCSYQHHTIAIGWQSLSTAFAQRREPGLLSLLAGSHKLITRTWSAGKVLFTLT